MPKEIDEILRKRKTDKEKVRNFLIDNKGKAFTEEEIKDEIDVTTVRADWRLSPFHHEIKEKYIKNENESYYYAKAPLLSWRLTLVILVTFLVIFFFLSFLV